MYLKALLPIEPNLININKLFIFEYYEYKKIDLKELNFNDYLIPLIKQDIFEKDDALYFLSKSIGTKKEPRYERYLFYKTIKQEYFFCQLNDYIGRDLINFCGASQLLIKLTTNTIKPIYQNWKIDLKRLKNKK